MCLSKPKIIDSLVPIFDAKTGIINWGLETLFALLNPHPLPPFYFVSTLFFFFLKLHQFIFRKMQINKYDVVCIIYQLILV